MKKLTSFQLLQMVIAICAALVISIYFSYRTVKWPVGTEAFECIIAFIVLVFVGLFLILVNKQKLFLRLKPASVATGMYIGLLWTVEISMNNVLHPHLPLRDILDDVFWGIIALLILASAFYSTYKTKRIAAGIKDGFWTGLCSGAIACLTALSLIVFGMQLILSDPLNIQEWAGQKNHVGTHSMAVYFAYQTLAGALLHLIVLGVIMGLLLGVVGGIFGRLSHILSSRF